MLIFENIYKENYLSFNYYLLFLQIWINKCIFYIFLMFINYNIFLIYIYIFFVTLYFDSKVLNYQFGPCCRFNYVKLNILTKRLHIMINNNVDTLLRVIPPEWQYSYVFVFCYDEKTMQKLCLFFYLFVNNIIVRRGKLISRKMRREK